MPEKCKEKHRYTLDLLSALLRLEQLLLGPEIYVFLELLSLHVRTLHAVELCFQLTLTIKSFEKFDNQVFEKFIETSALMFDSIIKERIS